MNKQEKYESNISLEILQELTPEEAGKIEKKMLLAAKIDNALKAKGWKKKNLAESLNKLPSEITKWLSGTHNFTTDTLWDIERVLDIELINITEKPIEQVISFHLSVSEAVDIKEFVDYKKLYSSVQLYCKKAFSLSRIEQKELLDEPLILHKA